MIDALYNYIQLFKQYCYVTELIPQKKTHAVMHGDRSPSVSLQVSKRQDDI